MVGSPRIRSGFTSFRVPRPLQSGQTPNGLLNENWRGSSSGNDSPHTGQAKRSEKSCDLGGPFASCRTTSTTPSASLSAVSIESARRPRSSARTTSRSTTTAISWFCRRFSAGTRPEVVGFAVDPHPHEAALLDVLEQIAELALPAAHQRRHDLDAGPLRPGHHGVGDLAGARPADRAAVVGAMGHARPGPEEPQVVVDLGDGADGRPRVLAGGLLLDGDGRRQALDGVDIGLLHEAQELPSIRRK